MKYAFMKQHQRQFRISMMSQVFSVSRSGYYDWLKRPLSARKLKQQDRDNRIKYAFECSKGRSGSPNITRDMHALGDPCNRKTVAESMRRQGLRAKAGKRFKVTTNSNHNLPVADNHLARAFTAAQANQKWVSDITYVWSDEGWLYLSIVLDLYSRAIIGWSLSKTIDTKLVCDALTMALWRRRFPSNVLIHSDQGSQYCSKIYQQLLNDHRLKCSMSRKGNCWDNSVAESFFHTLKVELIHGEKFNTRKQLRQAIFEYIEIDYNQNRRHSAIGYVSPFAFENNNDKVA